MHDSPVLRLPVEGTWKVIRTPGHDPFAFDLVAVDAESRKALSKPRWQHFLGRIRVEDTYSWSHPVFAPLAGTVLQARDGHPDREELHLVKDLVSMVISRPSITGNDIRPFAGNHVIIRGEDEDTYAFLAHLQQNSIEVVDEQRVGLGQLIGRVGNSGVTVEPHLHFQLFDQVDNLRSAGAPSFRISEFERWTGEEWQLVDEDVLRKGGLIRSVPAEPR